MDLTELPFLKPAAPSARDRAQEDVERFNDHRPELDLDDCTVEQLEQLLQWATAVNHKFTESLEQLQQELQREWLAKEQVLDEVFRASLDEPTDLF